MAQPKKDKAGSIFAIELRPNLYYYAQRIDGPLFSFFKLCSYDLLDVNQVVSANVLFDVWVNQRMKGRKNWKLLGYLPPVKSGEDVIFFRKDIISGCFFKYYKGGRQVPANKDECSNLEQAIMYNPESIEGRLRHFHNETVDEVWNNMRLRDLS